MRDGPVRGPHRWRPRRASRVGGGEALEHERQRGRRARPLVATPVVRPHVPADVVAVGVGDGDVGQADRLRVAATVRPGDARDGDRDVDRRAGWRAPSAIATATWAETAPCASSTLGGTSARAVFTASS